MKNVLAFLLLWLGLIVHSTLFQIPPLNVVQPDLVMVLLIIIALTRGPRAALVLGILIGLVQDMVFGSFLGLYAFTYGVVGYFAATAFAQFLQRNVAITFLVTIVFTFLQNWVTYGIASLFGLTSLPWATVLADSLAQMIVNGIALLLLYSPVGKLLFEAHRGRYREDGSDAST